MAVKAHRAGAVVPVLLVTALAACGSDGDSARSAASIPAKTASPPAFRIGCDRQSEADFPGAFDAQSNLVVGPLVMIGGRDFVSAAGAKKHGGEKFPLIVKAGYTVTVRIADSVGGLASLGYVHTDGARSVEGGKPAITFVACSRSGTDHDRSSVSTADGEPVTFWSGFVLTRGPMCVPLEFTVAGEQLVRRASLAIGRHCPPS